MSKPGYKTISTPEDLFDRLMSAKSDFVTADIDVKPHQLIKLLLDEHDGNNKEPEEEG